MLETITTSPVLRETIRGIIASQISTTPVARSVFNPFNSSAVVSPTRAARVIPALSTRKSISLAASITICTPLSVDRSATTTRVCAPKSFSSVARDSRRFSRRATTTMSYPLLARNIAYFRPIPEDAPVTRASLRTTTL